MFWSCDERCGIGECSFGACDLNDVRRERRLLKMVPVVAARATGCMTGTFTKAAAVKAAYRLFENEHVTHEALCAPHFALVREGLSRPGQYLLIEDTTEVAPASEGAKGLGPVDKRGKAKGFWLHSVLSLQIAFSGSSDENEVEVLGLLNQHIWARPAQKRAQNRTRKQRFTEARESLRWAAMLAVLPPAADVQRIYVADRESDIWEAFERLEAAGVNFVIRMSHNRAVAGEGEFMLPAVEAMPVREVRAVEIPRSQGEKKRVAQVELRYGALTVKSPRRPGAAAGSKTMGITVVHLREIGAPKGAEPLEWRLLTDLPVNNNLDAWRIVAMYRRRWTIEEFHKGLKTGAGMEKSQLSTLERLSAWCGVLSVVTVWLLAQKIKSHDDEQPELRPEEADPEVLEILEAQGERPEEGWTARDLNVAIAKLGGFQGRKCDGEPGWLTLWRGWTRIQDMLAGYRLAKALIQPSKTPP